MKLEYCAITDVGKVRKENQDSYGVLEEKQFFVVCDGMGGGAAGDFASRAAVDIILGTFERMKDDDTARVMGNLSGALEKGLLRPVAAIRLANRALHNFTEKFPRLSGMGTTVVAVLFDRRQNILHIYHVGDSRLYRLRKGELDLLTKDHSKINELIDQGKMKEDDAKTAEIQSMITRALGTGGRVKVDYRAVQVMPGDDYVLCTDGLNTVLDDGAIKATMISAGGGVDTVARSLIDAANGAGGPDNTTVLTMKFIDDPSSPSDSDSMLPSFNAITVGEEMPEQSSAEDAYLKVLLRRLRIAVPKQAQEKGIFENPLYLGIVITLAVVGGMLFIGRGRGKQHVPPPLQSFTAKVTGFQLEVRTPVAGQLAKFRKADDTIQKLQMIQDWRKDQGTTTVPLENVEIYVVTDSREEFKGVTSSAPLTLELPGGSHDMRLKYRDYRIMTDRMELKDHEKINNDAGPEKKPEVIIMVPGE